MCLKEMGVSAESTLTSDGKESERVISLGIPFMLTYVRKPTSTSWYWVRFFACSYNARAYSRAIHNTHMSHTIRTHTHTHVLTKRTHTHAHVHTKRTHTHTHAPY